MITRLKSVDAYLDLFGKSFRGLWSASFMNEDREVMPERQYSVTVLIKGEYVECDPKETALDACHEALLTIKANE